MSVARPTEIRALVQILESELFDPKTGERLGAEGYVKACIDKLDELRTDRPWWTVLSVMSDKWAIGYGPFTTDNKAREALGKGKIPTASLARINTVVKTIHPRHAEKALEEIDK